MAESGISSPDDPGRGEVVKGRERSNLQSVLLVCNIGESRHSLEIDHSPRTKDLVFHADEKIRSSRQKGRSFGTG
jgi:hypothetical protein